MSERIREWLWWTSTVVVGVTLGEWSYKVIDEWGWCMTGVYHGVPSLTCNPWWLP